MEAAVDSLAAACAAEAAGADRLELCSRLDLGGVTPPADLTARVVAAVRIPVFVMARPRAGGFGYGPREREALAAAVDLAREAGAAGVVLGALTPDGAPDLAVVAALVRRAGPLAATFHRAFDALRDPVGALPALAGAGITRVLTSGGRPTAREGLAAVAACCRASPPGLTVVAAGGVSADHVAALVHEAGVRELHLAGVRRLPGGGSVPDPGRVEAVCAAARAAAPQASPSRRSTSGGGGGNASSGVLPT